METTPNFIAYSVSAWNNKTGDVYLRNEIRTIDANIDGGGLSRERLIHELAKAEETAEIDPADLSTSIVQLQNSRGF